MSDDKLEDEFLLFFFAYFKSTLGNEFEFDLNDYENIAKNISSVSLEKKNNILSIKIIDK